MKSMKLGLDLALESGSATTEDAVQSLEDPDAVQQRWNF